METWIIRARWVCAAVLGAAAVALAPPYPAAPLAVALALAGLNTLYALRPSLLSLRSRFALDAALLAAYLYLAGDLENPLVYFFAIPVAGAALTGSTTAAALIAIQAGLLLVAMAGLISTGLLPRFDLPLLNGPPTPAYQAAHGSMLVLTMISAALLASRARRSQATRVRQERDRMETLLNLLPEGVVICDAGGIITYLNPSARARIPQLQVGESLALCLELARLAPIRDRVERLVNSPDRIVSFEQIEGDRMVEHAVVQAPGTGTRELIWVFRDVTEQRLLIAEVMHQAKMADLGFLAAGIAHEIGNPLSSMSAIVQLLRSKPTNLEAADRLDALHRHIARIGQIVRDVTDFGRPSAGVKTRIPLSAIVERARKIFELHDRHRDIVVEVDPAVDGEEIEAIEDQMVQVLLNLLLNAGDAMRGRGVIRLSASADGRAVRLSVRDSGHGIPPDAMRRIFTPFFTTKDPGQGTGLGLAVSESIVRRHGGRIEVASEPGYGSIFTVVLPQARRTKE
jgi:signal transduction histidine kinase